MVDIKLTPEEELYFNYLFNKFKSTSIDTITGLDVSNLFSKSKLERSYLKQIWDISNKTKTPSLTKIEFYHALRYVALIQNNKEMTKQNFSLVVQNKLYPRFETIDHEIFHPKPKLEVFEDDFEEFSEFDNNKKTTIPQIDLKTKIKNDELKQLDRMLKELKNDEIFGKIQDKTSQSHENKDNNNVINSYQLQNNSTLNAPSNPNNVIQSNPQNNNNKGLDSLLMILDSIDIEVKKETPSHISPLVNTDAFNYNTNTLPVDVKKQAEFNENELEFDDFEDHEIALNKGNNQKVNIPESSVASKQINDFNNLDFNSAFTNENIKFSEPKIEEKKTKPEEFNINSLLNDFNLVSKKDQVVHHHAIKKNENSDNLNMKVQEDKIFNTFQDKVNEPPKKDLMDLLSSMDFNMENNENKESENLQNNIPVSIENTNLQVESIEVKNQMLENENKLTYVQAKVENNVELDDLEFEEFEESKPVENNVAQIETKTEIPVDFNNLNFHSQENDVKIETGDNQIKEEKHTISNYTPNDFLRDFLFESKKVVGNENVPEKKNENHENQTIEQSQTQIHDNTFEDLVRFNLKSTENVKKFIDNSFKLYEKALGELRSSLQYLKKIKSLKLGESEMITLKNNKKFNVFINGICEIIFMFIRVKQSYNGFSKFIEFESYIQKIPAKTLFSKFTKKIEKFLILLKKYEYDQIHESIKVYESNLRNVINVKENKYCSMCFFILDTNSTNLFLHYFHFSCINFWINLIDQHSPYQMTQ